MKTYLKWIVILLGAVTWSWTMVKSGWGYSFGLGFWGANGHDGIWHLALIESLSRGSLNIPIFSGHILQNYHIGFDLILALIHKISFIPISVLYFQITPPVVAVLTGMLTYKFVKKWTGSDSSAIWSTFFVYFGGGFAYLIGKGESAFWSQEAISTLINPPFALSLIFLLLGLNLLLKEKKKLFDYVLAVVFFGILIEIKSYAGILALGGLFVAAIYKILAERNFKTLYIFISSFVLSVLLYLPLNAKSVGLISFSPFWFLESMIAGTDRLYLPKLAEAMLSFKNQMVIRKFIPVYLGVFGIFILGNFGTRMIFLLRRIKKLTEIDVFLYSLILAGILIPTFFIQKGTPWNTIQFTYYSLFFSGILAGVAVSEIKVNKAVGKLIKTGIVLLTIPTTILTLKDVYIPGRPPAMLPSSEVEALNFLKSQPSGVVLTYPFDEEASGAWTEAPKPLFLYTSTAYVSAFSQKDVYLEDLGNLDITGYDWKERLAGVQAWYKETDPAEAKNFLKENDIGYIYWVSGQKASLEPEELGIREIYRNQEAAVFKVE